MKKIIVLMVAVLALASCGNRGAKSTSTECACEACDSTCTCVDSCACQTAAATDTVVVE